MDPKETNELGKLIIFQVVGFALIVLLAVISPAVFPAMDPKGLQRSLFMTLSKGLVGTMILVAAACGLNWITAYNWWELLKDGNNAVGIATGGLFIGIGYMLSGAV